MFVFTSKKDSAGYHAQKIEHAEDDKLGCPYFAKEPEGAFFFIIEENDGRYSQ